MFFNSCRALKAVKIRKASAVPFMIMPGSSTSASNPDSTAKRQEAGRYRASVVPGAARTIVVDGYPAVELIN